MTRSPSLSSRLLGFTKRWLWTCLVYTIAAFLFVRWLMSPRDSRQTDGRFR